MMAKISISMFSPLVGSILLYYVSTRIARKGNGCRGNQGEPSPNRDTHKTE